MSINIFDADAYREFNSDLAGFSREQAWDHFQRYGLKENRRFSRFIDLDFYKYANPELATAGLKSNLDYFAHLQNHGIQEGRLFSPVVNMGLYVEFNPDLKQAFGTNREAAFNHLQTYALNEGREFSMIFDLNDYRVRYTDLAELNNTQLLSHFLMYGIKELRRSSNYFDLGNYSNLNEDLIPADIDSSLEALYHFATYGIKESPITKRDSAYKFVYTYRFPSFFYDTLNLETSVNHSNFKIDRTDIAIDQDGNRYTSFYLFNEINEISDSKTYTTRQPQGVFLGKYDAYGNLIWENPLELSNQENVFSGDQSVWLDQNNHVYLMANQISNIFQQSQTIEETHLGKYTTNGDLLWTKELSLNGKIDIEEIAIDNLNNFYIIGFTLDELRVPTGRFIFKYNSEGQQLWKKQLDSGLIQTNYNYNSIIAVDQSGNVYVIGLLESESSSNDSDPKNAYIAKYDSLGELQWKQQFSSDSSSTNFYGYNIIIKPSGNVQINGSKSVLLSQPIIIYSDDWYRTPVQLVAQAIEVSAEYDSRGNQIFYEEKGRNYDYSGNQGSDANQGLYPKGLSQIQSLKEGIIPWSQSLGNSYNIDQDGIVYNVGGNNLVNWFPIESLL